MSLVRAYHPGISGSLTRMPRTALRNHRGFVELADGDEPQYDDAPQTTPAPKKRRRRTTAKKAAKEPAAAAADATPAVDATTTKE
jgi:hypothetical protein